jgi:hypothetical protein
MSTIDVSCSILVAMAETPLLASRASFSSIGRMLAALLVFASGVQTLIYSSVACIITAMCVVHEDTFKNFAIVLYVATFLWLVQTACVATTLCSVFIYPFLYSTARMQSSNIVMLSMCALFGMIGTSLPVINRVALKFCRDVERRRMKHP